jgi:hypothetical protein
VDALRATRFFDDTVVVMTADHGDMLHAHGGMIQKWHVAYEEVVHVPFVVRFARICPSMWIWFCFNVDLNARRVYFSLSLFLFFKSTCV